MNSNGLINNSSELQPTVCRGVRGAVTVKANTEEAILAATRELLQVIVKRNEMHLDDIASVYFTTTMDLNATYPALAARQIGWGDVALLFGHEMDEAPRHLLRRRIRRPDNARPNHNIP